MFKRRKTTKAEYGAEQGKESLPNCPPDLWSFPVTRSQRVASAALLGVYGREAEADEDLIQRGLRDELSDTEIMELESRRPDGVAYRFGPDGRFGTAA